MVNKTLREAGKRFRGEPVAVFGLGRSGLGAIEFLLARGALVSAWDDDPDICKDAAARFVGRDVTIAPPETYLWAGIAMLVLSPGVPLTHPAPHRAVQLARAAHCPVVCDVELLYLSAPDARYVGITGTNGKSTTTALTHHCIAQAGFRTEVGGNIGMAATRLPQLGADGVYVLELSSYQLDLLEKTRINIAALLNITPDHIDRHGSMEGYIAAKRRIFERQKPGDTAIIAVDDEHTRAIYEWLLNNPLPQAGEGKARRIIPISNQAKQKGGVAVLDGIIFDDIDGKCREMELGDTPALPGRHNAQNIAAAYAVLRALGVDPAKIVEAVKSFPGLAHRLQFVAEIDGVRFVNDSKATNADAVSHALASYEDNIFWIAGGKAKEGGIASLERFFPRIRHAFLIGEAADKFAATLEGKLPYTKSGTLERAVSDAFAAARSSGEKPVVLLSPACASFDQFKDFEHRGKMFAEYVRRVINHSLI